MAGEAPMEWPWRPLVEEMGMRGARGAEDGVDGCGFDLVVGLGAGAVGVDVADLVRGRCSRRREACADGGGGSGTWAG